MSTLAERLAPYIDCEDHGPGCVPEAERALEGSGVVREAAAAERARLRSIVKAWWHDAGSDGAIYAYGNVLDLLDDDEAIG